MESQRAKYDIKGKNILNGMGKSQSRMTRAKNREPKKRGCRCRFNVKQLFYVRDVVEIVYYSTRHANVDGLVVYGDVRAEDRAWYAT
jgi:hypothetical protein